MLPSEIFPSLISWLRLLTHFSRTYYYVNVIRNGDV